MYMLAEGSSGSDTPLFVSLNKSVGGHSVLFFPEKTVAEWFFNKGIAEKPLIEWFCKTFIQPNKVFLDIGAHVGTYTLECAPHALHTHAFECNPKVFCYLAANTALHQLESKVTVHSCALGSAPGILPYFIRSEDGGGNGIQILNESDSKRQSIPVEVRTLDSFNLENIGCIKIDVEGFEKDVLMGARETLRRNGYPPFIFESWGEWKKDVSPSLRSELFEYIRTELGYQIIELSGAQDMFLASRIESS
jgi:FkbM family methyltransferase